jgi:glyoxylase-like metal-dependent hydrolase (beta-lactamase superfamily II)
VLGSYRRFGPSRFDPLLIRDRAAARLSLERILAWDFDRVILAHGDVVERGGRAALREGYAWLLAAGRSA